MTTLIKHGEELEELQATWEFEEAEFIKGEEYKEYYKELEEQYLIDLIY